MSALDANDFAMWACVHAQHGTLRLHRVASLIANQALVGSQLLIEIVDIATSAEGKDVAFQVISRVGAVVLAGGKAEISFYNPDGRFA